MKKRIPLIITAAALLLFAGLFFFLYRNNDTLRFHLHNGLELRESLERTVR